MVYRHVNIILLPKGKESINADIDVYLWVYVTVQKGAFPR